MLNFFRWPFRVKPNPDAFLHELRSAVIGTYNKADAYRDFRAVFQGHSTPEQGKRVLWEIMTKGRIYARVAKEDGNSHATYFRDGERNMVLYILETMNMEPSSDDDKPQNIKKETRT